MDGAAIAGLRMRAQRLWSTRCMDPEDALRWLTAVQAQEFAYARWSLAQRTKRPDAAAVGRAFDEGRILRTHVLRPTWHFVAPQDLRWLLALSGPRVNAVNARRYRELELDSKTLVRANDAMARAVATGHRTRRELAAVLERRRIATDGQRIAYLIMRAELDGVICSGAMRRTQHTYAAFDERVPWVPPVEREQALAELARRFFTSRGPATVRDFAWWSGFAMGDARMALDAVRSELEERVVQDRTYWHGEGLRAAPARPRIDLVQCYDESIISYSQSRDVLHTQDVRFPVPRNIDGFVHVLLLDGRLLGHWRQTRARNTLQVELRPARELRDKQRSALTHALDRYHRYLGGALAG